MKMPFDKGFGTPYNWTITTTHMENDGFRKPYYQASLGLSVRKVSNGYSIKINQSVDRGQIGRIVIAQDKEEVLVLLREIFDLNDQAVGDEGYYGKE